MITNAITYQHQGKNYSGSYTASGKIVTTTSAFGKKSAQVGRSPPALVARWLLGDMVRKADPA